MRTNSSIPCLLQLWMSDAQVEAGGEGGEQEEEDLNNWSSGEKYQKKSTHTFFNLSPA